MIKVEKISNEQIKIALEIRTRVFVQEQGVTKDEEYDGKDDICSHYLVFFNQEPIGTARVRYLDNKAKIERVAILKNFRGYGFGKALMLYIIDNITGVKEIILSSQIDAIKFYERLGFEVFGDEYYDARILHKDMKKIL